MTSFPKALETAAPSDLREVLSYCPETGFLTWLISPTWGVPPGTRAGSRTRDGYWRVHYQYREYPAHRIAWFLMTGVWPKLIDHKNLNRLDNRWENLREATQTQNNANSPRRGKYLKGVHLRENGKFQAQITAHGKRRKLGSYTTEEEAHLAYMNAAREAFGEFARAT